MEFGELVKLSDCVDQRPVIPDNRRIEELMAEIEAGKVGYEEAVFDAFYEFLFDLCPSFYT